MIMAGFRLACPDLDLQHPEGVLHRGIPMLETAKKAGEAQIGLLCVWPDGSCKVKEGQRLFGKIQREAMGEREQKCGKGPP